MLKKVLIANRGEIAVRIIRSARRLGIGTVAVFSDADRHAPHVEFADEALHIGPPAATESYLDIDKIMDAVRRSGADAIHPGYGFLSENPAFALACERAGVVFIGPSAEVIRLMGSKREAKALMARNGVPVVPGYFGDADDAQLATEAARIGYPVLIKASAGGGGRGMRLCRSAADFAPALASARREAKSAFGDDTLLLEKYIERPRHIEVQIFGDKHGNVVHLFERDCSIQRRYQKIIEEAPAANLDSDQRETIYRAAVTAGTAAGYVGAGTVEFVVDTDGQVYFIEMNTRLQVEHPVTEMITGEDLVQWQLHVAAGGRLPEQAAITATGHAFELRLCAEDADRDFAPSTGVITHFSLPPEPVRVDHGIGEGLAISPYYDSMIAKLIVHGADRDAALQLAVRALEHTEVGGITTNRVFLGSILTHPEFISGVIDTHFIENHQALLSGRQPAIDGDVVTVAALYIIASRGDDESAGDAGGASPWSINDAFRLNVYHREVITLNDAANEYAVAIEHRTGAYRVSSSFGAHDCAVESLAGSAIAVLIGIDRIKANVVVGDTELDVFMRGAQYRLHYADPLHRPESADAAGGGLAAPMPGTVLEVFVQVGQSVTAGTALMLIEAMKIEHTVTAPFDGTVTEVRFKAGDQIAAEGIQLAVMEPNPATD